MVVCGNLKDVMSRRTLYNQTLPILVLLNALVARADYSNTVTSLNPVAYWPLNEGPHGDVALNQSTNNPDLEVHYSGSVTSGVTGAIVADTNAAIALDGSTGYLFVPFHPALSQAGAFSMPPRQKINKHRFKTDFRNFWQ